MEKRIFENRKRNFWNLMEKNAENNSLTREQHDALADLANLRHNLHVNRENLFNYEADSPLWKEYDSINERLTSVDLEPVTLPDSESFTTSLDYDIDNNGLNLQEWWEEYYPVFSDEMENVNKIIEKYLEDIDKKHGTKYAPTGLTRLY